MVRPSSSLHTILVKPSHRAVVMFKKIGSWRAGGGRSLDDDVVVLLRSWASSDVLQHHSLDDSKDGGIILAN